MFRLPYLTSHLLHFYFGCHTRPLGLRPTLSCFRILVHSRPYTYFVFRILLSLQRLHLCHFRLIGCHIKPYIIYRQCLRVLNVTPGITPTLSVMIVTPSLAPSFLNSITIASLTPIFLISNATKALLLRFRSLAAPPGLMPTESHIT